MPDDRKLPLKYLLPLLLFLLPLVIIVQELDQTPWLDRYIFSHRQIYWRAHLDRCSLSGHFATMTDRLLLNDAFQPDFPRKKVYLIGGCLMEEVVNTTTIQSAMPRVGIYGMPGYNYIDLKKLVDWFVGGLSFGQHSDRHHLILVGLTMDLTEPSVTPSPAEYFISSDLYLYDDAGIRLKPMSAPRRWYLLHRKRYSQLLNSIWRLRPHIIARVAPTGLAPEMDTAEVPEQLNALRNLLRTLKATGATVEGVITPNATWLETPARIGVRRAMVAICQDEGIKIHDLSKVLDNKNFLDQDHLTYEGQQATSQRLLPVLTPYLGDETSD